MKRYAINSMIKYFNQFCRSFAYSREKDLRNRYSIHTQSLMNMLEFNVLFQAQMNVFYSFVLTTCALSRYTHTFFGFTEDILNSIRQNRFHMILSIIIIIIHAMLLNDLRVNKCTAIRAMCRQICV